MVSGLGFQPVFGFRPDLGFRGLGRVEGVGFMPGLGLGFRKNNQLRQAQYPTGCGKAYDVALICKWVCSLLSAQGEADSWML